MFFLRTIFLLLLLSEVPAEVPATPPAMPPAPSPPTLPAASDSIVINATDPTIDRVMFDARHPPTDMPKIFPNEAALTRCNYECRAGVSYQVIRSQQVDNHWHAVARIRRVTVGTSLVDTIYLPMMAPVLLRAHEEGHREMNERIYQDGKAIARSAAEKILSHDWEGDGSNADAAGKAATDAAVQQLCDTYLKATADRAGRLGNIYDRLTDHGRNNLYVANAIRLSFLEEKRLATTQRGELLHPTTAPIK